MKPKQADKLIEENKVAVLKHIKTQNEIKVKIIKRDRCLIYGSAGEVFERNDFEFITFCFKEN